MRENEDRMRHYGPQGNQPGHPFYGNQYSHGERYNRGEQQGYSRGEHSSYGRSLRNDDDEYEHRRRAAEMRDRDEYGRFTREDDRGGYSRGQRGDEEFHERRPRQSDDIPRDSYGRFAHEYERDRGRYEDDRDQRSRRSSENSRYESRYEGGRGRYDLSEEEHERRGRAAEERPRDSYGRFQSEDEDRGYSRRQYR